MRILAMNDTTPIEPVEPAVPPRRTNAGGSMLERAAARYDFAPRPVSDAARERARYEVTPAPSEIVVPEPAEAAEAVTVVPFRPSTDSARVPHQRVSLDRAIMASHGLIDPAGAMTLLAEEFRAIKRPILLDALGARGHEAVERGRMILVGSPRPGDGKSFCAANLALSLASEKDLSVLLVDADFAKPSVPGLLGIKARPGLLDALRDDDRDAEAMVVDTDVPGLSLLSAGEGGRDDTELLTSRRAGRVLERLMAADPRRLVVFDTPPVLVASPASVLAVHCGQILLVVRADRTTEADVSHAVESFAGEARLHLMLNAVSFTAGGRRFGSPYGYGETR